MWIDAICLVGSEVTGDWELIRRLKADHAVILIEDLDPEGLAEDPLLEAISVLVLDCAGHRRDLSKVLAAIKSMISQIPRIVVLLVDGNLTQVQVARAFRHGVRDYFRAPHNTQLLAERIGALCARVSDDRGLGG
jgi:DNA-binding response OmpR family regulator